MNPPYGREISRWMRKAFESAAGGATVVCLVPSRTDTKWFHNYAARGEIWFLRGRLKFGRAKASAPFPSAIVIFRPDKLEEAPTDGKRRLLCSVFDPDCDCAGNAMGDEPSERVKKL